MYWPLSAEIAPAGEVPSGITQSSRQERYPGQRTPYYCLTDLVKIFTGVPFLRK
jgi:hypothetical protein